MDNKNKKNIPVVVRFFDYPVCVIVIIICGLGLPFALPWMFKQRRAWQNSVKGSPKALILRGFTLEKVNKRGYGHFMPFQNHSLKWVAIMDPVNPENSRVYRAVRPGRYINHFTRINW